MINYMVIRVKEKQDPDVPFSGFAFFFYSKNWSLFLFEVV